VLFGPGAGATWTHNAAGIEVTSFNYHLAFRSALAIGYAF